MKKILIILGVLVLISIILTSVNNRAAETDVEAELSVTEGVVVVEENNSAPETLCFEHTEVTEYNSTSQTISLTFNGEAVTGTKSGTILGDEYSAGFEGTLEGTYNDDGILNLIYDYTVDGGAGREEERYRLENGELLQYRYTLKEDFENNILRIDESVSTHPDGSTFPKIISYQKTSCN